MDIILLGGLKEFMTYIRVSERHVVIIFRTKISRWKRFKKAI